MRSYNLLFLLIAGLMLVPVVNAAEMPAVEYEADCYGTTHLFHLNETSGIYAINSVDLTTAGNVKKAENNPAWVGHGKFGGGIYMNGSGGGDIGWFTVDDAFDTATDEGAIEFWFRPTFSANARLFQKWFDSGANNLTQCAYSGNNIECLIRYSGTYYRVNTSDPDFSTIDFSGAKNDTWYHLAMTWNDSGLFMFINGTMTSKNSMLPHGMPGGTYRNLTFGSEVDKSSSPFNGTIDEIRLSDISRSIFNGTCDAEAPVEYHDPVKIHNPVNGSYYWNNFRISVNITSNMTDNLTRVWVFENGINRTIYPLPWSQDENTILHLPFNGNRTLDASFYSQELSNQGGITFDDGKFAEGLRFYGGAYPYNRLFVNYSNELFNLSNFTISIWVKTDQEDVYGAEFGTGTAHILVQAGMGVYDLTPHYRALASYGIYWNDNTKNFYGWVSIDNETNKVSDLYSVGGTSVNTNKPIGYFQKGQWYRITLGWNGTGLIMWVNGNKTGYSQYLEGEGDEINNPLLDWYRFVPGYWPNGTSLNGTSLIGHPVGIWFGSRTTTFYQSSTAIQQFNGTIDEVFLSRVYQEPRYLNYTMSAKKGWNNLTVYLLDSEGNVHYNTTEFFVGYKCNDTLWNDTICGGEDFDYMITCRKYGGGTLYQWDNTNNMTFCSYGCFNGHCIKPEQRCADRCNGTDTICDGRYVIGCERTTTGCNDWTKSNSTFCEFGCLNGKCLTCVSTCTGGDAKCDGKNIIYCSDDNNDGCFEWSKSNKTACQYTCTEKFNVSTGKNNVTCQYHSYDDTYYWTIMMQATGYSIDYIIAPQFRLGVAFLISLFFSGLVFAFSSSWKMSSFIIIIMLFFFTLIGWMHWLIMFMVVGISFILLWRIKD